jgi:hypothetical protein
MMVRIPLLASFCILHGCSVIKSKESDPKAGDSHANVLLTDSFETGSESPVQTASNNPVIPVINNTNNLEDPLPKLSVGLGKPVEGAVNPKDIKVHNVQTLDDTKGEISTTTGSDIVGSRSDTAKSDGM